MDGNFVNVLGWYDNEWGFEPHVRRDCGGRQDALTATSMRQWKGGPVAPLFYRSTLGAIRRYCAGLRRTGSQSAASMARPAKPMVQAKLCEKASEGDVACSAVSRMTAMTATPNEPPICWAVRVMMLAWGSAACRGRHRPRP